MPSPATPGPRKPAQPRSFTSLSLGLAALCVLTAATNRREVPTSTHYRFSASLFGETVGEVHLTRRAGRTSTITYRSNLLVVRNKARVRQEAFIEATYDTASGNLLRTVARRCSGPADGSSEPECTKSRVIDRPDASVPALAAELVLARSPDGRNHCLMVTDEETGITGPDCAVVTADDTGVNLVGSKLGQEFRARVEKNELTSLELPSQGARFERTNSTVEVSDEDLFAEPIPATGDAAAALRAGRMRVSLYGPPASLKSLEALSASGQKVLGTEGGVVRIETVQAKLPRDPPSRRMLDIAALLVAKAAGSHTDCQAAAAWFVSEAHHRHWKVRPAFGLAYVDGRFAFHTWAIVDTPGGHVPVDPLLAQVPADAGHIQLAPAGEAVGTVLVSFRHGLALEVE